MTIQDAIDILNDKIPKVDDPTVKGILENIITDLKDFNNSPERGDTYALPEKIEILIPKSRIDAPFNRKNAGRLQQAVLNMIYGKRTLIPYAFFICTFIFAAIGLAVPLICNNLSSELLYFSIESAKDIIGIIFDCGCVVCATVFAFNMNKVTNEFRVISGIILMFIGMFGIVFTTIFAFSHPVVQGKIYYTIFDVISTVFTVIGIIITVFTFSKKSENTEAQK